MWHLERAFDDAQRRGQIPYDEPFIPENVIAESLGTAPDWPYWLDRPARLAMVDAQRAGRLVSRIPEEITTPWPDLEEPDTHEVVESWAVLELSAGGYVMGQARLRNFAVFIPGVTARSLAASVAVADAGRQLASTLSGEQPPFTVADLQTLRARTKDWPSQGGRVRDSRAPRKDPA